MATIEVQIGTVNTLSGGRRVDNLRTVQFEGEELASRTEYGSGRDGGPTDTRGTTETLYRAADGRLIVHVKEWSHWQGEPTTNTLREVTAADLDPTGAFALLGDEAGMGRALTLDEALEAWPGDEE